MDTQLKLVKLKFRRDINLSGFTLSEVILVLALFTSLLLLFLPFHNNLFQEIEANNYMEQLENDLLLAQQLTIQDHPNYWMMIRPQSNDYYLYDYRQKKTLFTRTFPSSWKIQLQTLSTPVQFNSSGTLQNPGIMRITTPTKVFKITFSFGKSRVKIDEQ
ncbi:competence type IV pilus minor pilin ComGD [Halobacillus seohaensis]|uniref:Competence type IV pilus minor pilin ComGD n=1 Tax=Halobacillus seohaensis TaxID=447421 RepID=A0ABW2EJ94_9BACI